MENYSGKKKKRKFRLGFIIIYVLMFINIFFTINLLQNSKKHILEDKVHENVFSKAVIKKVENFTQIDIDDAREDNIIKTTVYFPEYKMSYVYTQNRSAIQRQIDWYKKHGQDTYTYNYIDWSKYKPGNIIYLKIDKFVTLPRKEKARLNEEIKESIPCVVCIFGSLCLCIFCCTFTSNIYDTMEEPLGIDEKIILIIPDIVSIICFIIMMITLLVT